MLLARQINTWGSRGRCEYKWRRCSKRCSAIRWMEALARLWSIQDRFINCFWREVCSSWACLTMRYLLLLLLLLISYINSKMCLEYRVLDCKVLWPAAFPSYLIPWLNKRYLQKMNYEYSIENPRRSNYIYWFNGNERSIQKKLLTFVAHSIKESIYQIKFLWLL